MCDTCGCNVTSGNKHLLNINGKFSHTKNGHESIEVLQGLLTENDHQAAHIREHLDKNKILTVNIMSSPGSGKTSLLEKTIDALKEKFSIAVIEGDLETENDAERIRDKGVEAIQITTGSACHLDAHMVHDAMHQLDLSKLDIIFIENVGNLVCPASFNLGQHKNVILLSTPEGDDKPAKYPVMFRSADLVLLTKIDLLPYLPDFNPEHAKRCMRELSKDVPVMQLSANSGVGMQGWLDWLDNEVCLQQQFVRYSVTPHIHDAFLKL